MTLWFVFALMTAAAIFAVLWPLPRRRAAADGSEVSVYRDQLEEIDRDRRRRPDRRRRGRGRAGRDVAAAAGRCRRSAGIRAAAEQRIAPVGAVSRWSGCCRCGRRWRFISRSVRRTCRCPLAAAPARARLPAQPLANLVAQVEAHLEKNPEDGRGWEVWRRSICGSAATTTPCRRRRNALGLWRRQPCAGRSRRGAGRPRPTASSPRRPRPRSSARWRSIADDFKASYFLGSPPSRTAAPKDAAVDLARACWQGAARMRRGVRWCRRRWRGSAAAPAPALCRTMADGRGQAA